MIAIIAILAAILFPVFARARENARRASCQSNLKQIALGVFMYNQDYDEKLPLSQVNLVGSTTKSNPYGWADALQPYLKSTQIFQCPSENNGPNDGQSTGAAEAMVPAPDYVGYSDYWYNYNARGKADASFSSPSLTVLLGDGINADSRQTESGGGSAAGLATLTDSGPAATSGAHRHLTGCNIAYADGHVKWAKAVSDTSGTLSNVYNSYEGTDNNKPTFAISS